MAGGGQAGADHRTLVLAEQSLDAFQGRRIDVPDVPREVRNQADLAVMRCVKAMIHARCQAKGDVAPAAKHRRVPGIAEQIFEGVGEALDLKHMAVRHAAGCADNCIARADDDARVHVDRSGAVLQRAGEAIVQAAKAGLLRIAQVEIGEELPDEHRDIAHQRLLDPAEPAHESGQGASGDTIGQQEVQFLLLHNIHYR